MVICYTATGNEHNPLSQRIKVNTTNNRIDKHHVAPDIVNNIASPLWNSCQNAQPKSNHKETGKLKLRDILQNSSPALLKKCKSHKWLRKTEELSQIKVDWIDW